MNTKKSQEKSMLKGIDLSAYQRSIDLNKVEYDFLITKATEGMGYVNPYCDKFVQHAIKQGKQWGFYHFAITSNDPIEEARYFVKHTKNYFTNGIPVLDYEGNSKHPPKPSDVDWCKRWIEEVQRLTGVTPLFYTYEFLEHSYDWTPVVLLGCKLWLAKYPPMSRIIYNYDFAKCVKPTPKHWRVLDMIMWQFAGDNGRLNGYDGAIDCNVFYGGVDTWKSIANPKTDTEQSTNEELTELELARQEIERLKFKIATLESIINRIKAEVQSYR